MVTDLADTIRQLDEIKEMIDDAINDISAVMAANEGDEDQRTDYRITCCLINTVSEFANILGDNTVGKRDLNKAISKIARELP